MHSHTLGIGMLSRLAASRAFSISPPRCWWQTNNHLPYLPTEAINLAFRLNQSTNEQELVMQEEKENIEALHHRISDLMVRL
jgi:hypothetical protein